MWDTNNDAGLPLLLQDSHASFIYGPGGMLLEEITSDDDTYFYHQDQQGSVRVLSDANGNVTNAYSYDAYGQPTYSTGDAYNPFGYTGEYTDQESGLIYLRARYYEPSTQQFLNVDPIVGITGQPYAYAGGSPTNYGDPSGLDASCGLLPNPFDEQSCIREGLTHPLGPWVVAGGVVAATGGIACLAGGCEAAAAVASLASLVSLASIVAITVCSCPCSGSSLCACQEETSNPAPVAPAAPGGRISAISRSRKSGREFSPERRADSRSGRNP